MKNVLNLENVTSEDLKNHGWEDVHLYAAFARDKKVFSKFLDKVTLCCIKIELYETRTKAIIHSYFEREKFMELIEKSKLQKKIGVIELDQEILNLNDVLEKNRGIDYEDLEERDRYFLDGVSKLFSNQQF